MKRRLFHLVGVAILVASSVVAQDMTWNGAATSDEWYAFNFIEGTWNPQVWVNNWGQEIYRYPDDPAPTEMTTPTGTATIPTGYVADVETQVQVSSVQLGGTLEIGAQLSCATLNVAGETLLHYHGRVSGCAIQGDGPDGFLSTDADSASTYSGPTLDGVTLSLPTLIGDGKRIFLANTVHNLGVIQLLDTSAAGETRLTVDSDVTLSGAGWVETSGAADNEIGAHVSGDHRLTNQSTIHAAGRIGGDTIAVTNQGLIVADRPTMLTVDPTDTPLDGQPGVVNQGTLRAADGGTLSLVRGSFANAGGVVEALDGSVVELGRAASLSGGQLSSAGSG